METLAPGIWALRGFPKFGINMYWLDGILVDAATRLAFGRIRRNLGDAAISAHVLTHAHPDHNGASRAVCRHYDCPLWCGRGDAQAMETGDYSEITPGGRGNRFPNTLLNGPPHPVATSLVEGDEVAEFTVIETPGHTPGHVSLWRESDGVLITGDVVFGMNIATGRHGLHEPPGLFTLDPALNRVSLRKVAALKPRLLLFGHGKPLADGDTFQRFVDGLPD